MTGSILAEEILDKLPEGFHLSQEERLSFLRSVLYHFNQFHQYLVKHPISSSKQNHDLLSKKKIYDILVAELGISPNTTAESWLARIDETTFRNLYLSFHNVNVYEKKLMSTKKGIGLTKAILAEMARKFIEP